MLAFMRGFKGFEGLVVLGGLSVVVWWICGCVVFTLKFLDFRILRVI